jgi:glycosyltransferase involved in cell wall biosynthesis
MVSPQWLRSGLPAGGTQPLLAPTRVGKPGGRVESRATLRTTGNPRNAVEPPGSQLAHAVRTAIVHDWLDTWRGGERVLAEICNVYENAEVFALVDFLSDADRSRLGGRRATTSFLQRLPFARRHFRRLLPLFPRAIESLDVSAYDLVISSSHAVAKGVRTHRGQLHVCYCYTPMRYAWDLRDQYLRQTGLDHGVRGWLARRMLDRIRAWDRAASERVDHFVAISRHIASRIRRCYDRESTVIYPPVATAAPVLSPVSFASEVDGGPTRGRSYVTVSQLVPYKRVDLIAEAFRRLPDRELVVIGEGPERARIETIAGPNTQLLGRLSDRERDLWLAKARAFVFAAEEDFGIAPLEAQAHGTPVIALARGGALETIRGLDVPAPTGVLFAEQTADAIVAAVRAFESNAARITPAACIANARRFEPQRFRRELRDFVDARWAEFADRKALP